MESGQERQRDGTTDPVRFPLLVDDAGKSAGDSHAMSMSIPRTPTRLPRILYLSTMVLLQVRLLLAFFSLSFLVPRSSSHSHAKHGAYSREAHRTRTRQAPKPPRPTRITHSKSKSKSSRRVRDSQLHTMIHPRTGASQRVLGASHHQTRRLRIGKRTNAHCSPPPVVVMFISPCSYLELDLKQLYRSRAVRSSRPYPVRRTSYHDQHHHPPCRAARSRSPWGLPPNPRPEVWQAHWRRCVLFLLAHGALIHPQLLCCPSCPYILPAVSGSTDMQLCCQLLDTIEFRMQISRSGHAPG